MKVLVVTWGWRSHLYPLVPLAWALRSAGHDVVVAGPPDLVGAITDAGLPAVPVGGLLDFAEVAAGQVGPVADGPSVEGADRGGVDGLPPTITADGVAFRYAAAMLPELVDFGRFHRPDLVLHEPGNLAAAVAAAALRVPSVRLLWGPDHGTRLRLDVDAVLGPLVGGLGLGRALDPADVALDGTLTLDPCPPPMQVPLPVTTLPIRFVPYNGTAVLPGWLRRPSQRPLVCLTRGTLMAAMGLDTRFDLVGAVRALAELDVTVVLALSGVDLTGVALPADVRVCTGALALHLLLPRCAAVVHQGGAGTTMTAAACGVPQLVVPAVADQHFNAERVVRTGAGTALPVERAGPGAVRDAVAALLADPGRQAMASELRRRSDARPAPSATVPHLEQLAAEHLRTRRLENTA
ncbi:nucleotide disphospho-sugar-binding domain-containing protein [Actinomycetes bacterium KLBMP 9759]